ncbi:hypothetical protein EUX98_g5463 [Antrodiella citrinella]|uniref:Uncharacterized protein n=1 Tax=Antrodiella citrinella TaxID=2447956 RepID=A0A4S4MU96_9APHY|nr:hypothetical protein EUX98_g5463 [Antrodiella citrinella]
MEKGVWPHGRMPEKDYPNVQFWDKASYTQYLNNSRKNNTARNRPGQKYPEDVNASQQYIEDENGNIVSGQTAKTAREAMSVGGYPGSYDDTLASTDLDLDSVMTPAIARSSSHGGTTEATTGADKEHFMDVDEEFVPPHIQDTFPPLPLDQYRADQTSQTPDSTTESETRTTESESASGLLMSPVAVASSSSQLDQEMEQPQPEAITGSAQLKPSLITVHKPLRSSSRIQDLLLTTATSEPEDTLDSQPEPEDLQATATASGSNDSHSNKPDSRVGPTASSSKLPLIGAPATGTAGLGPCKPKGKPATVKAVTKHKANARISVQSLCLEKFLARDPDGLWRDFQVEFKNLSADETKELEAECQIRRQAKAASAKASS